MAYEFIDSIGNDVDVVSDSEVSSVCLFFYYLYMLNMSITSRSAVHLIVMNA